MSPRCAVCLVYGYGQNDDGTLNEQTIGRCEKALELYRQKRVQRIFITVGVEKNGVTMSDAMKKFFLQNKVSHYDLKCIPRGVNTSGETDVLLRHMKQFLWGPRARVYVVSSWYHLPRICFLWFMRGRIVKPIASRKGIHSSDLWIEPLKMCLSIVRPYGRSKTIP